MILYPELSSAELLAVVADIQADLDAGLAGDNQALVDTMEHEITIILEEVRLRQMAADANAAPVLWNDDEAAIYDAMYADGQAGRL